MITGYPDKNSLKEVFGSELSSTALKRLCRSNGIFLLSNKKADVINTAHLYYWGFEDVNRISQLMEDQKNYKKSFRLTIEKDDNFTSNDDTNLFADFLSLVSTYRTGIAAQKGYVFETFTVDMQSGEPHIKASVEHKKRRKGRVKLIDEVSQRFSLDAFEEDNKIIADIIFDDRSSVQIAKNIITDSVAVSGEFHIPKQISLTTLTTSERVELFDQFFSYHFSDWMIEAVKNIKVQMSDDIHTDDEDEVEEVENNFLEGIESALFTGSGLRTNPIIIDAVNRGYFFPRASVMLNRI